MLTLLGCVVLGWFLQGFLDEHVLNKPQVFKPEVSRKIDVLAISSVRDDATAAQREFWHFIERYHREAQEEASDHLQEMLRGQRPEFRYLEQHEDVIGNLQGAQ